MPYPGKAHTAVARAVLPTPIRVCSIVICPNMVGLPVFGFLMCAQMLIPAIVYGGCTDTVRVSALKVDCEKNP